jgi:H/ACA ribonucleoprotein complex subunit 1
MGLFVHAVEDEMLCASVMADKVPYFNAPIYLQNKSVIGKVDEILGPINEVYFSIKMGEGMVASSFKKGDKVYIGGDKLLPIERFLPKPKIAGGMYSVSTLTACSHSCYFQALAVWFSFIHADNLLIVSDEKNVLVVAEEHQEAVDAGLQGSVVHAVGSVDEGVIGGEEEGGGVDLVVGEVATEGGGVVLEDSVEVDEAEVVVGEREVVVVDTEGHSSNVVFSIHKSHFASSRKSMIHSISRHVMDIQK